MPFDNNQVAHLTAQDSRQSIMNGNAMQPVNDQMGSQAPSMNQGQRPSMNYISQDDQTDEREQAFETAFKDTAYNIFSSKHGQLVPYIVTFKVINTSIDDGDGIGAFILDIEGENMYVPIVMSDNMLKPMEVVYSKKMDKFLPFSKEWLNVITSTNNTTMGEGVKIPETLPGDKDITRLIYPPIHGRTSYAMDFSAIDPISIIKAASDKTKNDFKQLLQMNKTAAAFLFTHHDKQDVLEAVSTKKIEKTASVPIKLETLSLDDPSAKLKDALGTKSNAGMQEISQHGFTFKDDRVDLNKVLDSEVTMKLEEPMNSGVYNLYTSDGEVQPCLVICNPCDIGEGSDVPVSACYDRDNVGESVYGDWSRKDGKCTKHYMIIKENGDYLYTNKVITSPSNPESFKGAIKDYVFGDKKNKAINGSNICFIKVEGSVISGTKAKYIHKTEVGRDGFLKYIKHDPYYTESDKKIYGEKEKRNPRVDIEIVHSTTPTGKILSPCDSDLTFIPLTYKVIKLGDKLKSNTFLQEPNQVLEYAQKKVNETGGRTVKLANAGAGEYTIDGINVGSLKEASYTLADKYHICARTARDCFKKLAVFGDHKRINIIPHEKHASIFARGHDGTQMSPEAVQQDALQARGPAQQAPEMPQSMEGFNTGMMDVGMRTQDPELFNVGVLNSLSHQEDIRDLLAVHSPNLEKSLDSLGRMLITFWMKGSGAKEKMGDEAYHTTEDSLRTVFKELGRLILKLNQTAVSTPEESM